MLPGPRFHTCALWPLAEETGCEMTAKVAAKRLRVRKGTENSSWAAAAARIAVGPRGEDTTVGGHYRDDAAAATAAASLPLSDIP
jgi:hypothetical protein